MKTKIGLIFCWLYFQCFCFPFQLFADEIYLKDGRVLKGTLIEDGDNYILQMKYGKMKIAKSKVVKIEKEKEETPPPKNEEKKEPISTPSLKPKKPEIVKLTLTTDERIEKVLNQFTENLLKSLFEPQFHSAGLELLKENRDCRLIPLIFQKMESTQTRNIEVSLLLSKSTFKVLVDSILALEPKNQIPYEQLFGRGLRSSSPFVRVLSAYGLKQMKVFMLSHAQTLLEDYDYSALYTQVHPSFSDAHYLARAEILLAIYPFAEELAQENPQLVEKKLEMFVFILGGFSQKLNENPSALFLKKWGHPKTPTLLIQAIEKSLKQLGESRYYNEDLDGKAVDIHLYGSHLQTYLDLLVVLPNPQDNLKQLYPSVRLSYQELYSEQIDKVRKNLFYQVVLKYVEYGDEILVKDFVQYLSDYASQLTDRLYFKKGTLESRMFDFLLSYHLKYPDSISEGFGKILRLSYLEEDILRRAEILVKKYPQQFEGFEDVFREISLRKYVSSELKKTTLQILFSIHSPAAQQAMLSLAEQGTPDVAVLATAFLKKWK